MQVAEPAAGRVAMTLVEWVGVMVAVLRARSVSLVLSLALFFRSFLSLFSFALFFRSIALSLVLSLVLSHTTSHSSLILLQFVFRLKFASAATAGSAASPTSAIEHCSLTFAPLVTSTGWFCHPGRARTGCTRALGTGKREPPMESQVDRRAAI